MAEGRSRGDLISGAVLAGLGIFVIVEARQWDYLAPDGPGPGFFPMWYGIALVVLSLVLVASNLRRQAAARQERTWNGVGRALGAWAALAAAIGLLKILGFMVSFALLTLFIVSFMYRRSLLQGVLTGAGAAAAFYLIFPLALNVNLPVGILGF